MLHESFCIEKMISIYNQLFDENSRSILDEDIYLDPNLLHLNLDKRLGISLHVPVQTDFSHLLTQLKLLEPDQYFYPASDWHITLQVIATGKNQFNHEHHPIKKYISTLEAVFKSINPFKIDFQGLTVSKDAVLAQGFSEELQEIRNKIRKAFEVEGFSIQERYFPQTAHVTLMRFCKPMQNPKVFVDALKELRNIPFGSDQVDCVHLNICDWYNQKEKRQKLSEISLKHSND